MFLTSFGVFLYVSNDDSVLFCERPFSIQFIDMFNSKCPIHKVVKYVSMCTDVERDLLKSQDINKIYRLAFFNRDKQTVLKRYKKIKSKIEIGLTAKRIPPQSLLTFPRGRQIRGETPRECAEREFYEETLIDPSCLTPIDHQPFVQIFTGSDSKVYRYILYPYKVDSITITNSDKCLSLETKRNVLISRKNLGQDLQNYLNGIM